ncbi:MAG: glycosyltransferase [Bacteroidaceae bacterium]|nr:glycosyltransferase [Bacteroidaceae bacterium]
MDGKEGIQLITLTHPPTPSPTMKVLILSTTERTGGGAIAAKRLGVALRKNGIDAKMLVRDKQTSDSWVYAKGTLLPKILERLSIMALLFKPLRKTWQYDLASHGIDILSTKEYQEADVIHLHWINQGLLSLGQLNKILLSGKRVVWTMHDEWPFRGIIHYTDEGTNHTLTNNPIAWLERRLFKKKQEIYQRGNITFVGCSQWITDLAKQAMPQARIRHINNCIPQEIFFPQDVKACREAFALPENAKLILFTCQKVTDKRKGMSYLLEALQYLQSKDIHLVVVGGEAEQVLNSVNGLDKSRIHFIPYVNGEKEMARLYSAVDCFVTPSLQDNLPNTIAEAMSCGTPCVGFNAGGIPEMITHMHDGYVAKYCDSQDLARGIECALSHPEWKETALSSARKNYSETNVAKLYSEIYTH